MTEPAQFNRGERQKAPAAATSLHPERTSEQPQAERKNSVSALNETGALTKHRDAIVEVSYTVGSISNGKPTTYTSPTEAAKAFNDAPAQDQPYVIRTQRQPNGQESASLVGSTSQVWRQEQRGYGKSIGANDEPLHRAYTELTKQNAERGAEKTIAAPSELNSKSAIARPDPERSDKTNTYERAVAFDQLPRQEALARHPELDATYKQLLELKQSWHPKMSQDERENSSNSARDNLSQQLHRGEVPQGNVTMDESRHVIDAAAAHRNLMVRDSDELKRNMKGEVVAQSSQHVLLKISDMIAVRYQKTDLDREAQVGEKVAIQYAVGKSQVHEQGNNIQQDQARENRSIAK